MNDKMEPLVQFSPFAGRLTEEIVPGEVSQQVEFENDVHSGSGRDRSMWCYAPKSGCPDSKQTQVLFVLRDGSDCDSAQRILDELKLAELAEEEHFLILLPNPVDGGWNWENDPGRENDMDFLVRCFGLLRGSRLRVNGFNGMLFYLAATPAASALMTNMIALRPADVSAAMLTELPTGYRLPENALRVEAAAWCRPGIAEEYLKRANRVTAQARSIGGVSEYRGENPEVRLLVSEKGLTADTVRLAWDKLFSPSRRWQNDVYGSYHHRTAFTERGFTAHISDSSLGVNGGFGHTWFEYVPPQLRGSAEKVPLVFYFHGINCVPLYGAEQSCWHDIADRENFIVVYPAPARNKAWNIYDLPQLVSDIAFVLALLERMKREYAIDESRVYLSGFSMGGAMTHALSAAYPELFAAAAPCNAFAFARYDDPVHNLAPFLRDLTEKQIGHVSYSTKLADEKKTAHPEMRMPIFQSAGMEDGLMGLWPVTEQTDDIRSKTINWWKGYNNITRTGTDTRALSGLDADESFWQDGEKRYLHQRWFSEDTDHPPLLELILAKRMPHAVDPVELQWAWQYMKQFARRQDGSLTFRSEEA